MLLKSDIHELARQMVCTEARRWIGVTEKGDNDGEFVRGFQHYVVKEPDHEAWCADFVSYCVGHAIDYLNDVKKYLDTQIVIDPSFKPTESVLKMVREYEKLHTIEQEPKVGRIAVWHRGKETTRIAVRASAAAAFSLMRSILG